jgi:hypothetical protein
MLTACGGGGGGGSSTPTATQNPNGFWVGTFTESGITYELIGMIYDNKFTGISTDAGVLYSGNIGVSGDLLSGTVDVLIIGGGYDHSSNISAVVKEGVSISGTATDANGTSAFTLSYDSLFDRVPDLNLLAGTFSTSSGTYTYTMTVNSDGTYAGSDTDGCGYSGTFTLTDGVHNLYDFTMTVTTCGLDNGSYIGKAFLDDFNVTNDILALVINNPSFVLVASTLRQ